MLTLVARRSLVGTLCLATGAAAVPSAAQAQQPSDAAAKVNGIAGVVASLAVLVAFVVAIVIVAKLLDLKKRRESQAVMLQSRVADALMREGRLGDVVVTPTVRVPFWSGRPATIELTGRVPTQDIHEAVLYIARSEARRLRSDVVIDDRITVVAMQHVWAA
jgi:hypothetical protein